jgi:hypothetical protein
MATSYKVYDLESNSSSILGETRSRITSSNHQRKASISMEYSNLTNIRTFFRSFVT